MYRVTCEKEGTHIHYSTIYWPIYYIQAIVLNMGRKIINDIVLHLYVGIMVDSVTPEVQEST